VLVPILLVNRSKELWGDDAHTFRPERWIDGVPESVKSMPGPWSNMLTFIGGPHACIGYRFSLYECVYGSLLIATWYSYSWTTPF
jgi:cytochrome P450